MGSGPSTCRRSTCWPAKSATCGRLTLTAGGVAESVTITAEVTPVQTATSQLTKNITSDTLVSVQVKGRDIFGMMKILPGVVDTTNSRDFAQWNSGRGLSINGGNSLNKNTTIDGVPVGEEGGDGTTHITPNIDAVGEVNVITSGYTAENGRQSSGLISIVTKSGTNQFRGSGWYNARRDEWNKNGYFDKKEQRAKPFFEVNISGYSFGGPVIIPKRRRQPDEPRRRPTSSSRRSSPTTSGRRASSRTNLPTALERQGDFSQTLLTTGASTASANGIMQTIIDPDTTAANPNGTVCQDNKIPQNRWQPDGSGDAQPAAGAEQRHQPGGGRSLQLERRARRHAAPRAQELRAARRPGHQPEQPVQRQAAVRPRPQHHVQPRGAGGRRR